MVKLNRLLMWCTDAQLVLGATRTYPAGTAELIQEKKNTGVPSISNTIIHYIPLGIVYITDGGFDF